MSSKPQPPRRLRTRARDGLAVVWIVWRSWYIVEAKDLYGEKAVDTVQNHLKANRLSIQQQQRTLDSSDVGAKSRARLYTHDLPTQRVRRAVSYDSQNPMSCMPGAHSQKDRIRESGASNWPGTTHGQGPKAVLNRVEWLAAPWGSPLRAAQWLISACCRGALYA